MKYIIAILLTLIIGTAEASDPCYGYYCSAHSQATYTRDYDQRDYFDYFTSAWADGGGSGGFGTNEGRVEAYIPYNFQFGYQYFNPTTGMSYGYYPNQGFYSQPGF